MFACGHHAKRKGESTNVPFQHIYTLHSSHVPKVYLVMPSSYKGLSLHRRNWYNSFIVCEGRFTLFCSKRGGTLCSLSKTNPPCYPYPTFYWIFIIDKDLKGGVLALQVPSSVLTSCSALIPRTAPFLVLILHVRGFWMDSAMVDVG